jgi:uncharacterized membrane protein
MTEGWTVLIAAHAAGATLALLLGGYLVLRGRKGDLLHRRVGRVWFVSMYWVAFSSFGIKRLTPGHFSWIHGLSAWTIISLTIAIWAAATHRIDLHKGFVVGSYFGLVGAGLAATAFPQRLVPQTVVHHPVAFLVIVVQIAALAWLAVRVAGMGLVRPLAAEAPLPPETGVPGQRDRLGAGRHLELGQARRDVVADGLLRQEQPAGDRRVVAAAGDQVEHLALALGELRERRRRRTA